VGNKKSRHPRFCLPGFAAVDDFFPFAIQPDIAF
jgi:hypothetical protein